MTYYAVKYQQHINYMYFVLIMNYYGSQFLNKHNLKKPPTNFKCKTTKYNTYNTCIFTNHSSNSQKKINDK